MAVHDENEIPAKRLKADPTAAALFRKQVGSKDFAKLKRAGKSGKITSFKAKAAPVKGLKAAAERSSKTGQLTKKQRKKLREKSRPNYAEAVAMKVLWEKLREAKEKQDKIKFSTQIFAIVKGNLDKFAYAHDTCRVIEHSFHHADQETKHQVWLEAKAIFNDLAQSRYGKFLVLAMIRYGSKEMRDEMISLTTNKVRPMFLNSFSGDVIEELYNNHADRVQRARMQHEIYSKYLLMELMGSSDDEKVASLRTLQDVIEFRPTLKTPVLKSVKEFLLKAIGKKCMRHSFLHRVLLDFFNACGDCEEIAEIVPLLHDWLLDMTHTPDGAKILIYSLWFSTPKQRRAILKGLKEHVVTLCASEHAYLILVAAIDCVDDTRQVNTSILQPILANIGEIANHRIGRKALVHTFHPRHKTHFNAELVAFLSKGDGNPFSKKDTEVRQREIAAYVEPAVLSHIKQMGVEAYGTGKETFTLVQPFITSPFVSPESKCEIGKEMIGLSEEELGDSHIVQNFIGYTLLKNLIQASIPDFLQSLTGILDEDRIKQWLTCQRGASLLACIAELGDETDIINSCRSKLRKCKSSISKCSFEKHKATLLAAIAKK